MTAPNFNMHRYSTVELPQLIAQERLPRTVKPVHYHLHFKPYLDKHYFDGTVKIKIICLEATKTLILHADDELRVLYDDITVTLLSEVEGISKMIAVRNVFTKPRAQMLILDLAEELHPGASYELFFTFTGYYSIGESLSGLVKRGDRSYPDSKSSVFICANTFPNHARKMFPCFDEPSFKAPFDIVVSHPNDVRAMSVMPVDYTEKDPSIEGWVEDHFARTPPIATYSVSLTIGNFKSKLLDKITTSQGSFDLQIHAEDEHHLMQMIENTVYLPDTFKFFGDFLGVEYSLPKLDISFVYFLSFATQVNTLGTMTIEQGIMHRDYTEVIPVFVNQWLHHLITPEWWSEFNITSFLGAFLSTLSYTKLEKRDYWNKYGWGEHNQTYCQFGVHDTQNIHNYELGMIIADRGGWFVRMVNSALNEKTFKAGLKKLFTNNLYGTFTEKQFWDTLTEQGKLDGVLPEIVSLYDVAKSWLSGDTYNYPVLNVARNYENNSAVLDQRMFILEADYTLNDEQEKKVWWLPVVYLTSDTLDLGSIHATAWMGEKQLKLNDLPGPQSFIIINPMDDGLFLVNYDKKNWELICQCLIKSPSKLHHVTRRKVLYDALHLNTAGLLDYTTVLNMTLFLFNEQKSSVFMSLCGWLRELQKKCRWTAVENKINKYLRCLILTKKRSLDSEINENKQKKSFVDIMLTGELESVLSQIGTQREIDNSHEYIKNKMPTFTVYDDESELTYFFPEFMKDGDNYNENKENAVIVLEVLSSNPFFHPEKCPGFTLIMQRFLAETLEDGDESKFYRIMSLSESSSAANNIILDFVLEHSEELKNKMPTENNYLWKNFLSSVTGEVKVQENLNKLSKLCELHKNDAEDIVEILATSVDVATRRVEWLNKNVLHLESWLDKILPQLKLNQDADGNIMLPLELQPAWNT